MFGLIRHDLVTGLAHLALAFKQWIACRPSNTPVATTSQRSYIQHPTSPFTCRSLQLELQLFGCDMTAFEAATVAAFNSMPYPSRVRYLGNAIGMSRSKLGKLMPVRDVARIANGETNCEVPLVVKAAQFIIWNADRDVAVNASECAHIAEPGNAVNCQLMAINSTFTQFSVADMTQGAAAGARWMALEPHFVGSSRGYV
jgi:hypothetical protein